MLLVVSDVAAETQQLSYVYSVYPDGRRHTHLLRAELVGHSRQPMTGRLATHPSDTAVKI